MQTFLDVQRSTMLKHLATERAALECAGSRIGNLRPPVSNRQWRWLFHEASPPAPVHYEEVVAPATNGQVSHEEAIPGPAEPDPAPVAARLLAIVRERTGYPSEMLRLDLDLEADLGIDSIKRVEILGTLRDALSAVGDGSDSELMEQLSRARTLGAIVERVARRPAQSGNDRRHPIPAREVHGHAGEAREGTRSRELRLRSRVRRMVLEAVDAPFPRDGASNPRPAV